ncbi:MAG: hypothetical protein HY661_19285 [Betaproteobacteria bacterium]|nr:hypothetical protein [Betaproteobacteria bacterium]
MSDRPEVKPGDWVIVGGVRCVVANIRALDDRFGDCEVVFNPSKPTNRDIKWSDGAWHFVETGDFGGYADHYERLRQFVQILKSGRS